MNEVMYQQCHLVNGQRSQSCWIPAQYAVEGKYIKLRDRGGQWEDGWLVKKAYSTAQPESMLNTMQLTARQWREATDV